ncbi:MAG TPA: UDP-N-acetylglucosamine 1-carboxyvinyltransferase [Candidatus Fournierella merdigallinarum]|nr:UDP-N-acetylglucosamine 1-carboxyvinyltransferase [Candidatus Fournierella merdigallinarum]
MEKFVINGGRPLVGEVTISGAKNAAVAILPATILAADKCVIENLPAISDVTVSLQILSALGAKVRMLTKNSYEIDTTHIIATQVPDELSRQMRASYYFLGALLGRFGCGRVAMPGGCNLGPRPIDQHLKAFCALGAQDSVEYGMIEVSGQPLTGAHVFFDTVSVGATMNAMLSAVLAEGQTVLENVAKEPHIVDLANFLNMMGADVRGAGTDVIKIRGRKALHGCTYSIIPDQIEAGSYMVAAAITGGNVLIKNVIPKHLEPITAKMELAGVIIEEYDDAVRVVRTGDILPLKIKTMPHPGFPTDMQPLMTVLLTLARGTSIITEGIWENRFRYVDELVRMGANIQVDGQVAVIEGVPELQPAPLRASDLRAGAALVMAALAARGSSEIDEISHIERGYEDLVEKLQGLGADIRRVEKPVTVLPQAL